jgi:hypothetical protein
MTTEEMITNFRTQLEECVARIKELDTEMNVKKEEYFKLVGAVQALELAGKGSPDAPEAETPSEAE